MLSCSPYVVHREQVQLIAASSLGLSAFVAPLMNALGLLLSVAPLKVLPAVSLGRVTTAGCLSLMPQEIIVDWVILTESIRKIPAYCWSAGREATSASSHWRTASTPERASSVTAALPAATGSTSSHEALPLICVAMPTAWRRASRVIGRQAWRCEAGAESTVATASRESLPSLRARKEVSASTGAEIGTGGFVRSEGALFGHGLYTPSNTKAYAEMALPTRGKAFEFGDGAVSRSVVSAMNVDFLAGA